MMKTLFLKTKLELTQTQKEIMMKNNIRCPVCDSRRVRERHTGKKGGAVAGGVSGVLSGAAIGSAIPVVGTLAGAAVGALLGRFIAGATAGAVAGATLDGVIFERYECVDCNQLFD
ncbi:MULTISPECIES: hypothetical protein [Serratia]|uniref:hypothetical protein n=1 Tax=Serratia TaxID=613 RepID=UPI001E5BA22E|nr:MULTISPECIES: hypothetical protein [Serratia]